MSDCDWITPVCDVTTHVHVKCAKYPRNKLDRSIRHVTSNNLEQAVRTQLVNSLRTYRLVITCIVPGSLQLLRFYACIRTIRTVLQQCFLIDSSWDFLNRTCQHKENLNIKPRKYSLQFSQFHQS